VHDTVLSRQKRITETLLHVDEESLDAHLTTDPPHPAPIGMAGPGAGWNFSNAKAQRAGRSVR